MEKVFSWWNLLLTIIGLALSIVWCIRDTTWATVSLACVLCVDLLVQLISKFYKDENTNETNNME